MMRIKHLVFLFLISCSSSPEIPRLTQTLALLLNIKPDLHIPRITYAPLSSKSAGYYNRLSDTIHINSNIWPTLSPTTQELILIHEIGHGGLKRPHLNTLKFDDGCPESIMLYNIEETCYIKYKSYYLEELFSDSRRFYPYE